MTNNESRSNISSRRSSWTQEDDELFEQLIQDLSIGEELENNFRDDPRIDFSKIREELNSKFLDELSNSSKVENDKPQESLVDTVHNHLPNRNMDSIIQKTEENYEEKPGKKEGVIYDSFREWIEANRKIIDLEKEEDDLYLLELFVAHKERELVKKIISSHEELNAKKLFFRKESYDSSDEEDNSKNYGGSKRSDILVCHYTSGNEANNQKIVTKSQRIFSTSKFIDKYSEGTNFYEQLKDIIVGGDLESGGSLKAVSHLNKTKKKIETFFGIDMSEESWVHFKNYIRKIILDYNNLDVKTEEGKNLTGLSETDYLKELYPISNEKNKSKPIWMENFKASNPNTNLEKNTKRISIAKLKALKLLYGSSGYAESLLIDNFPPVYFLESGFLVTSTPEERKEAIENEMRNLELKLVNSANKEEFKWIEHLINFLKDSSNNISTNVLDNLTEDQWKELEELVEEIGKRLEVFNNRSEMPKVIEIPSDQFKIPKPHLVEEPISKDILLENTYDNVNIPVNSWKSVLNDPLDFDNIKYTSEEMNNVKRKITENGFYSNSANINNQGLSSLRELQKITKQDTEWNNLDDVTSFPTTKYDYSLFKLKNPILATLKTGYKHLKNGIVRSNDWNIASKLNQDEDYEVSPYSFKIGDLYSYLIEKSHISTKYALMETRKIANLFFKKDVIVDKDPKSIPKRINQTYHELLRDDAKNSALDENIQNNNFSSTTNNGKSQQKLDENEKENEIVGEQMESQNSTTSTNYLSNTFSIDESIWRQGDLIQLSKGLDVVKEINNIRNDCLIKSFKEFSKLANLPDGFDAKKLFSPIVKTMEIQKNILPRVGEIQEHRFDKISLLHLEQTVVQLEGTIASKSLSGIEPSDEEKKTLQTLKQKLEDEKKRLDGIIYTDTISPLEQSKLESLGIFQQSIKLLTPSTRQNNNKEVSQDLVELERDLIIDREFRILDQLLDQMNREQRREVLSFKPTNDAENSNMIQKHQESIKAYAKLRSYYNQILRKDSSMKEWQSLTVKEKLLFEREFRKQSKNGSYEGVVNSVSRMMQSSQFAETFSFISTALSKKIIESRSYSSESTKLILESYQKEKNQIRNTTLEFIQKNGIDQRYKTKLISKHRKLDPNEKRLREVYNYDNYSQSIMVNQLENSENSIQEKLINDIVKNELTKDELYSIVSHQYDIQKLFKKERLTIVKKVYKKSSDNGNILTVEESNEDPLFGIFQRNSVMDYITLGQITYFQRLFEELMTRKLEEWREKPELSTKLFVSPHYLKNDNSLELDLSNSEMGEYEKLTSKVFDINLSKFNAENQPFSPVFPEVPWSGSYKDLQLLYLKMQLDRSNNPHYTRSVLEFNDSPERFLQQSFWKGVWMLPESLSNFIYTSDPSPNIKLLPPSQPKQIEKKPPPVFTPSQPPPIVTPIIPTIPVPTVQTPPPPITQNILPPQMPSIPRIQIPIQRPTIQPPTLPTIQPPSQPSIIPQRSPVLVPESPIYPSDKALGCKLNRNGDCGVVSNLDELALSYDPKELPKYHFSQGSKAVKCSTVSGYYANPLCKERWYRKMQYRRVVLEQGDISKTTPTTPVAVTTTPIKTPVTQTTPSTPVAQTTTPVKTPATPTTSPQANTGASSSSTSPSTTKSSTATIASPASSTQTTPTVATTTTPVVTTNSVPVVMNMNVQSDTKAIVLEAPKEQKVVTKKEDVVVDKKTEVKTIVVEDKKPATTSTSTSQSTSTTPETKVELPNQKPITSGDVLKCKLNVDGDCNVLNVKSLSFAPNEQQKYVMDSKLSTGRDHVCGSLNSYYTHPLCKEQWYRKMNIPSKDSVSSDSTTSTKTPTVSSVSPASADVKMTTVADAKSETKNSDSKTTVDSKKQQAVETKVKTESVDTNTISSNNVQNVNPVGAIEMVNQSQPSSKQAIGKKPAESLPEKKTEQTSIPKTESQTKPEEKKSEPTSPKKEDQTSSPKADNKADQKNPDSKPSQTKSDEKKQTAETKTPESAKTEQKKENKDQTSIPKPEEKKPEQKVEQPPKKKDQTNSPKADNKADQKNPDSKPTKDEKKPEAQTKPTTPEGAKDKKEKKTEQPSIPKTESPTKPEEKKSEQKKTDQPAAKSEEKKSKQNVEKNKDGKSSKIEKPVNKNEKEVKGKKTNKSTGKKSDKPTKSSKSVTKRQPKSTKSGSKVTKKTESNKTDKKNTKVNKSNKSNNNAAKKQDKSTNTDRNNSTKTSSGKKSSANKSEMKNSTSVDKTKKSKSNKNSTDKNSTKSVTKRQPKSTKSESKVTKKTESKTDKKNGTKTNKSAVKSDKSVKKESESKKSGQVNSVQNSSASNTPSEKQITDNTSVDKTKKSKSNKNATDKNSTKSVTKRQPKSTKSESKVTKKTGSKTDKKNGTKTNKSAVKSDKSVKKESESKKSGSKVTKTESKTDKKNSKANKSNKSNKNVAKKQVKSVKSDQQTKSPSVEQINTVSSKSEKIKAQKSSKDTTTKKSNKDAKDINKSDKKPIGKPTKPVVKPVEPTKEIKPAQLNTDKLKAKGEKSSKCSTLEELLANPDCTEFTDAEDINSVNLDQDTAEIAEALAESEQTDLERLDSVLGELGVERSSCSTPEDLSLNPLCGEEWYRKIVEQIESVKKEHKPEQPKSQSAPQQASQQAPQQAPLQPGQAAISTNTNVSGNIGIVNIETRITTGKKDEKKRHHKPKRVKRVKRGKKKCTYCKLRNLIKSISKSQKKRHHKPKPAKCRRNAGGVVGAQLVVGSPIPFYMEEERRRMEYILREKLMREEMDKKKNQIREKFLEFLNKGVASKQETQEISNQNVLSLLQKIADNSNQKQPIQSTNSIQSSSIQSLPPVEDKKVTEAKNSLARSTKREKDIKQKMDKAGKKLEQSKKNVSSKRDELFKTEQRKASDVKELVTKKSIIETTMDALKTMPQQ